MAPSTLNTSVSGPGGGAGCVRRIRAASAVWWATSTAPAASVRRRAVSACSVAPVKKVSSVAALANEGCWVLRRTSASWSRGVRLPGRRPNSSSRGEKPGSAGRAGAITAFQREVVTTVGLERARLSAGILERMVAVGTARVLEPGRGGPISAAAGQGQILQQSGTHTIEPRIEFELDLTQGRGGMGKPPGTHCCRHVLGQLL